jgi:glycosyltransferase involved in cell wall biosynthesis
MLPPASRDAVVPVADEGAFAERLEGLLRDPVLRRTAGERHRVHARENYSLDVMVQRYDALFRGLIAGRRRAAGARDRAADPQAAT